MQSGDSRCAATADKSDRAELLSDGAPPISRSPFLEHYQHHVPLTSSFRVFRLNCLHQEAKSRLEGGELEPVGSGEVAGS